MKNYIFFKNIDIPKILIMGLIAFLSINALAKDIYPSRPIKLIVGWPAGGGVDVLARAFAHELSEKLGQQVIVENKPGASEIIGAQTVAASKADGHTLFFSSDQALISNIYLYKKLSYDPKMSFDPITRIAEAPMLIIVSNKSSFHSVDDIVRASKDKPEKISYASNGPGSLIHVAINWFSVNAGIKLMHVPYKGGAPAIQAVLSGEVDITAVPLAVAEPFLKSNMARVLAVTSSHRLSSLPEISTMDEIGYPMGMNFLNVLVAPAGTPKDVIEKIYLNAKQVIDNKVFQEKNILRYGYKPIGDTPKEFSEFLKNEYTVVKKRIELTKVQLD